MDEGLGTFSRASMLVDLPNSEEDEEEQSLLRTVDPNEDYDEVTQSFVPPPPPKVRYLPLIGCIVVSIGVACQYTAYFPVTALLSSLDPTMGNYALSAISAAFCVFSFFFAPPLANLIGYRFSMVLGSLTFLAFMVGTYLWTYASLMTGAIVVGCGSALMWSAQGNYMATMAAEFARSKAQAETSSMGFFTGILISLFQLSHVIGNFSTAMVISQTGDENPAALYFAFMALTVVGGLFFLALPPTANVPKRVELKPLKRKEKLKSYLSVFYLFGDKRMLLIILIFFYYGVEIGFLISDFTLFITDHFPGAQTIGYVISVFGIANGIVSFIMGPLSDRIGKRIPFLLAFVMHAIVFVFLYYIQKTRDFKILTEREWLLYVVAMLYGIGEAVLATVPLTLVSVVFSGRDNKLENAFAIVRVVQNLAISVTAFLTTF